MLPYRLLRSEILLPPLRLICIAALLSAALSAQTPTSVTLTASPNPAAYGHPLALSATLPAGATGKVTFYDGTTVLGVATISGGTASLSTIGLQAGSRKLRAYYPGDASYSAATSGSIAETVRATASNVFAARGLLSGAGLYAQAVATGDFDNDGKADLVLKTSYGVTVVLGNGDSTFRTPIHTSGGAGFTTQQLAVSDFNGDGKLDLAVVQQNPNSILIFLGNGNGTFQAPVSAFIEKIPLCVLVGDFNGDGKPDLAVLDQQNVNIFLGMGNGSFYSPAQYATSSLAFDLGIGDFDGDGNADVVAGNDAGFDVLFGKGDGTFRDPVNYPGNQTMGMAIGDFNGDGKDDIAALDSSNLWILTANAQGTFQPAIYHASLLSPSAMVAGDFNGDGKLDLAIGSEILSSLSVLPGNGDGTFGAAINYLAGKLPRALATGDFNGDGRMDIAVADQATDNSAAVTILQGVSATMAAASQPQSTPLGLPFATPLQVVVTDTGGSPVSGVMAAYTSPPSGAGASFSNPIAVTDAAGLAGVTATANTEPGTYSIIATAGGMTATLPLTNFVDSPASLTAVSGTPQSSGMNAPFAAPLQIALKNSSGQPVIRATIGFAAPSTGVSATFSSTTAVTDSAGRAQVWATANNTSGTYNVVASIGGLTMAFVLTNVPAVPVTLASSPNPSVLGRAVAITATLPAGSTGKVTFYDGTTVLGVGRIVGQTATLSTVLLAPGVRSLRAYYTGDASHPGATSNGVTQTVNAVPNTTLNAGGAYSTGGPYGTGYHPESVVVGDFNGDGRTDLAVPSDNSSTTGSVTVLLGNGDGSFQPGIIFPLNGWAASLAVGDFDGDGKPDLAVALPMNNAVTILLGNGDGTFRLGASYAVGRDYRIAAGDFNHDGAIDLVVANYLDSTVSVLLGKGDGTFLQPTQYNSGSLHSNSLAVADFNGDGFADLVIGQDSGNNISILLNNGDGSFGIGGWYSAASAQFNSAANSVIAGDFNGDGKMDVATVGYESVSILLGNGDGSFQAPSVTAYPEGTTGTPAVGDFNGDGKLDLVVGEYGSLHDNIQILLGNGDGTFQPPLTLPATPTIFSIAPGEFNGDGRQDLVYIDGNNRAVRLLLGAVPALSVAVTHASNFWQGLMGGTYSITVANSQSIPTAGVLTVSDTLPAGVDATSIGGAGWSCSLSTVSCTRSDSLAPGASFPVITVSVNVAYDASSPALNQVSISGGGAPSATATDVTSIAVPMFATSITLTASPMPSNLGQNVLLTAKVSGAGALGYATFYDGATILGVARLDMSSSASFTANALQAGTHALHARYGGDGINAPSISAILTQTVRSGASAGFVPSGGALVNGQALSVAVGDLNGDGKADLVIANGSGMSVLLGNGNSTFQPPVDYTANTSSNFVVLADLNGDGKLDIIAANSLNNNISVFLGDGDGNFEPGVSYRSDYAPTSIAVGDLNGDGLADLAVVNSAAYTVSIFLGNGNGTFRNPVGYQIGVIPYSVAIADFNGDSKPDLAVTNWDGSVRVLFGNGNGTFQSPTSVFAGANPIFLAAGDFNGDGTADLAVVNWAGSNVSVLLGKGDGTFLAPVTYPAGAHPSSLAVGDFNGDGKLDLAVGAAFGISVLSGNGDGTFVAPKNYSTDSSTSAIGVGDFNSDGKTDLVITFNSPTVLTSAARRSETSRESSYAGATNVMILQGGASQALSITVTHPSDFYRGQTDAAYTVTVTNAGFAASSGTVSVVDTIASGLTATNISGAAWSCTLGTLTCTRTDVLQRGSSYPAITVTGTVAGDAATPQRNSATVSGGGSPAATGTDSAVVLAITAALLAPTPGTTLAGTSAIFSWNPVTGADQYWLDVGNSAGSGGLWAGALTATLQVVSGLPCDGRTIYVQLFTRIGGVWQSPQRYTYAAPSACTAQIASPVPSTLLTGPAVTFSWSPALGADQYWLDVGNSVGHGDLSAGSTTGTSKSVGGLPCDGRTLFVQLWTHSGSSWQTPQRYTYTAATCAVPAQISLPAGGSALGGTSVTFSWTSSTGADQYWLDVGNSIGHGDLSAGSTTGTSKNVTGLPCDGRTLFVQLWTHFAAGWQTPQRYTYTAATCVVPAQISAPTPGTVLSTTAVTFSWNAVPGADQYWLDIGNSLGSGGLWAGALTATSQVVAGLPCDARTIYAQLYTHLNGGWQAPQRYTYTAASGCSAAITSPPPGSALTTTTVAFSWSAAPGADQYWLDVGTSAGTGDIWNGALTGTSQSVSGLPCDGRTIHAQLYAHRNGAWLSPARYTYTAPNNCMAQITSPAPGAILAATTITFSWNATSGADQYWLDVGNSVAVGDIWNGALTGTSQVVSGLVCDGRTIYAQLYTHRGGAWLAPQRYTYTAPAVCLAQITSPAPGSQLTAATVTISWSPASGADQYWLDVGNSVAVGDIWGGALTGTSQVVSGLACDGRTIYAQLYTHRNGAWLAPQRVTYTAKATCGP